jgi:hypothetical protein
MANIARIVVTETGLTGENRKLFTDFITESKSILPKGGKHQFVLLPAGFLKFSITSDLTHTPLSEPKDKTAKQKWDTNIEALKEQALAKFHQSFDSEMLNELKAVAHYLVIGIDSNVAPDSKDIRIQFVLVYDLQSEKPLHWTGKSYPKPNERDCLIKMPIDTHFIKDRIGGKKIAVFGCHDLSIFNPRHQRHFSPFDDERRNKNRKENTAAGKIKCRFIDATLDFNPDIMLQLPHTEGTWAAKWTKLNEWMRRKQGEGLQHFATGLQRSPKKQYTLSGTQRGDVMNFANGTWIDTKQK